MTANDSVIALDYTHSLSLLIFLTFQVLPTWTAETEKAGAELEIVTALPTSTHKLADYSNNLAEWMTAIETELSHDSRVGSTDSAASVSAGCVAIGSDYDAPAGALSRADTTPSLTSAGIYHWLLMTHRGTRRTQVIFHPKYSAETRACVIGVLDAMVKHRPARSH